MFASLSRGLCATPGRRARAPARARAMRVDPRILGQRWCWLRRGAGTGTARGRGGVQRSARARRARGARARARAGVRAARRRGRSRRGRRRGGQATLVRRRSRVAGVAPAVARKPPRARARAPQAFDGRATRVSPRSSAPPRVRRLSRASDVFPPRVTATCPSRGCSPTSARGHVRIRRRPLPGRGARPTVSDLIRETKARQLDAYRHRISVLCPGVDADTVASEAEALDVLARGSEEEVGFLQTFNLHRPTAAPARPQPTRRPRPRTPHPARVILSRRLAKVAAELLGVEEDERGWRRQWRRADS